LSAKRRIAGRRRCVGAGSVIVYFEFSNGNASASQVTPFQQLNSLIVPGVWEVQQPCNAEERPAN
jgi:hypothetical protein